MKQLILSIISGVLIGFLVAVVIPAMKSQPTTIESSQHQKIDSLQSVISNLQGEIIFLEDGFDSRESRYEDIIFRYEMSLDYLKYNHPKAYKDFIRISQMKENYDIESDREFKKQTTTQF